MNNLTTRYLVSFGFLAILIVGGLAWSEYQLATQELDSRVVNISGRQRMLSQKISKAVAELALKPDAETSTRLAIELEDALHLWESSQNALRFGDASLGITGGNSPVISRMYEELDPLYERIFNAGNAIVTLVRNEGTGSSEFSSAASKILSDENNFLTSMNDIVFAHDSEASARVANSRIIVFLVNVLLLLFLAFSWVSVIRPALRKARAIDKEKTEFVSLSSHQLRTPLSAINWYAEMLISGSAGEMNEKQKKYTGEIYQGGQRMATLVEALLNVSRIELGTFVLKPEPTDISALSKDVVTEMQSTIGKKHLRIEEKYASNLPQLMMDAKYTRDVLQNLVSNAVKFTPPNGTITIAIDVRKKEENIGKRVLDSDSLVITVSDTGYGIPKNQQERIFSKLFRADNVRDKDTDGTGLGLYIVKSIVENSSGKVWFESVENKGTMFYVTLPLAGMKKKEGAVAPV